MYVIVAFISSILRIFYFPNPFTKYFEIALANNAMLSSSTTPLADLFNFAFGGFVLWMICYPLVGIVYDRGEAPIIGSLMYLGAVLINSKILIWISEFADKPKVFLIVFIGVIIIEFIVLALIRVAKEYFL